MMITFTLKISIPGEREKEREEGKVAKRQDFIKCRQSVTNKYKKLILKANLIYRIVKMIKQIRIKLILRKTGRICGQKDGNWEWKNLKFFSE